MPWNRACPRPDRGTTRKDYKRNDKRYESNVTDKEWAIIEPMLPEQGPMGRPRQTDLREVLGAIQYVLATGCQWRALPRDFRLIPRSSMRTCNGVMVTSLTYEVAGRTRRAFGLGLSRVNRNWF